MRLWDATRSDQDGPVNQKIQKVSQLTLEPIVASASLYQEELAELFRSRKIHFSETLPWGKRGLI